MGTPGTFRMIMLAAALASLAACHDSDVPPGTNSTSILDGEPDSAIAEDQVDEADILPEEYEANRPARLATAVIHPTQGNTVSGRVLFIQPTMEDQRIRIVGKLINIPAGEHGFHIHESGNCTAADASSAGDHFNPTSMEHGAREAQQRHAGDLGNLSASADEVAEFDFFDEHLSFNGVNSITGKAFIVHAGRDDLSSQPAGNSGDRIGCGVIDGM